MNNTYTTVKSFAQLTKKSESTIRKFIKEYSNKYKNLFVIDNNKKSKRYYIYKELAQYFNTNPNLDIMYRLNKRIKRKEMNKIIKKKSIRHTLRSEYANKWNLFGSISYNGNLNIDSCNYQFYRLEKYLKKVFKLPFEIIYTTELNEVRGTGHHNHFVARVCSENDYMPLKRLIDAFFRNASLGLTDIRKYNQHLDGFGYILKDVDRLKDGFGIVNSGL